jgi:hypothetical protein
MAISVEQFPLNVSQAATAGVVTSSSAQAGVSSDAGPRDEAPNLPAGWTTPPAWWATMPEQS